MNGCPNNVSPVLSHDISWSGHHFDVICGGLVKTTV